MIITASQFLELEDIYSEFSNMSDCGTQLSEDDIYRFKCLLDGVRSCNTVRGVPTKSDMQF